MIFVDPDDDDDGYGDDFEDYEDDCDFEDDEEEEGGGAPSSSRRSSSGSGSSSTVPKLAFAAQKEDAEMKQIRRSMEAENSQAFSRQHNRSGSMEHRAWGRSQSQHVTD
jgi:hypothetical protein